MLPSSNRYSQTVVVTPIHKSATNPVAHWMVVEPFDFHWLGNGAAVTVTVPGGLKSDGASIPWPFKMLMPKSDPAYIQAAILHDYMAGQGGYDRAFADRVFFAALRTLNVSLVTASIMYIGLRIGAFLKPLKTRFFGDGN